MIVMEGVLRVFKEVLTFDEARGGGWTIEATG
jgi:hypothetical protein